MAHPKIECKFCGKFITKNNIVVHEKSCEKRKPSIEIKEDWKISENLYKCPFCSKLYNKKGISTHIWRSHTIDGNNFTITHNPNVGFKTGTRTQWNKGLTKETDSRVLKHANGLKIKYANGDIEPSGFASKKYIPSEKALNARLSYGGYRPGAGRSKKYKVFDSFGNDVLLQSSYELRCSEILNELNIKWIRPKALHYDNRKYYGDFYLTDYDVYLDPKNPYKARLDKEKIEKVIAQNKIKLYILFEENLTKEYILDLIVT